jgi:hypothetical protein
MWSIRRHVPSGNQAAIAISRKTREAASHPEPEWG